MPACPVCNASLLSAGGTCPACGSVVPPRETAAPRQVAGGTRVATAGAASEPRTAIEVFPEDPAGRSGRNLRRQDEAKETMLEPVPRSVRQSLEAPARLAGSPPIPPPLEPSADDSPPPADRGKAIEGGVTERGATEGAGAAGGGVESGEPEVEPLKPDTTPIFRPVRRPPVPRLVALDDGQLLDGEVWRLRRTKTIIGRVEGTIIIPSDPDISAKHLEIAAVHVDGKACWRLVDLNSTNGTFVRVNRAPLADGKELILASHRYRVRMAPPPAAAAEDIRSTRPFHGESSDSRRSILLERLTPDRQQQFRVGGGGATIGADASQCDLVPTQDPFLSPMHARISCVRDRWQIEDAGSVNGTWIRIDRVTLDQDAEFQIGEQRFRFILSRDDNAGL